MPNNAITPNPTIPLNAGITPAPCEAESTATESPTNDEVTYLTSVPPMQYDIVMSISQKHLWKRYIADWPNKLVRSDAPLLISLIELTETISEIYDMRNQLLEATGEAYNPKAFDSRRQLIALELRAKKDYVYLCSLLSLPPNRREMVLKRDAKNASKKIVDESKDVFTTAGDILKDY